jgi:REP-associated tyrosine transposase
MPRTARASVGGYCYHVLNRGNGRARVFHDADDYNAFLHLLRQASARVPMRLIGYCLMPNHFHLVLCPFQDGDLSEWMQWLLTAQVHGYRKRYRGSGHVWQGRFKAFPIEQDDHLLQVLRYVERNALRAGLVERAELWEWFSLPVWLAPPLWPWLDPGPVPRPASWLEHVQPRTPKPSWPLCERVSNAALLSGRRRGSSGRRSYWALNPASTAPANPGKLLLHWESTKNHCLKKNPPGQRGGCPPRFPQIRTCATNASGSSNHRFTFRYAIRGGCVYRLPRYQALDRFPRHGSMTRHPLPSTGSRRKLFPCFTGTTRRSDFSPPVSPHFVILRLAIPSRHSDFAPDAARVRQRRTWG